MRELPNDWFADLPNLEVEGVFFSCSEGGEVGSYCIFLEILLPSAAQIDSVNFALLTGEPNLGGFILVVKRAPHWLSFLCDKMSTSDKI